MSNSQHHGWRQIRARLCEIVTGTAYRTPSQKLRFGIAWVAAVLGIATVIFLIFVGPQELRGWQLACVIFWGGMPPIWFWFDQVVLWEVEKDDSQRSFADFAEFTSAHESSRQIWLALVVLISLRFFSA